MRKTTHTLAILALTMAILALLVPAASLACKTDKRPVDTPVVPPVPITIPDSSLTFLDAALNDLATAIATHNDAAIAQYLTAAEQKLGQAMPDSDNVKVKVRADLDARKLTVNIKVKPDAPTGRCHHEKTIARLKVSVKVRQADDGLYHVGLRIKGDLTEQQEAYLTALVAKYQGQMPGVVMDLKIK